MSQYSSISGLSHVFVAGGGAIASLHNPGGPVMLNPQPLPPRVYAVNRFGAAYILAR